MTTETKTEPTKSTLYSTVDYPAAAFPNGVALSNYHFAKELRLRQAAIDAAAKAVCEHYYARAGFDSERGSTWPPHVTTEGLARAVALAVELALPWAWHDPADAVYRELEERDLRDTRELAHG